MTTKSPNLCEHEVYDLLKLEGLSVPKYKQVKNEDHPPEWVKQEDRVVIKAVGLAHKSDSQAVLITEGKKVKEAHQKLLKNAPETQGVLYMEYIDHPQNSMGHEIMMGVRWTPDFGYILVIGPGGTGAEHLAKNLGEDAFTIVALDQTEDISFLKNNSIYPYLKGEVRGTKKLVDDQEILKWINGFKNILKKLESSSTRIAEFEINPLIPHDNKLMAVDGLIRLENNESKKIVGLIGEKRFEKINKLLKPKTIAIIGVSEKSVNPGRAILINLVASGFDKENVWIIKDKVEEIEGCKCVPEISKLPQKIDLFISAISAHDTPKALHELADRDMANSVLVIGGGFAEKEGGEKLEQATLDAISKDKFVMNGGNCLGILAPTYNTLFIPEYKLPLNAYPNARQNVAFISQSGAYIISRMNRMQWINPRYFISTGNQSDLTISDFAQAMIKDENVEVVAIYSEGFKELDGINLSNIVKELNNNNKDVIIYKAGRTEAGRSAVQGHTASIAGDYPSTFQILQRSGAFMAESFDQFEDMVTLCSMFKDKINGSIFPASNAGFECAAIADHLNAHFTELSFDLKKNLSKVLKEFKLNNIIDVRVPLDLTPMANDKAILGIIQALTDDSEIGLILFALIPLTPALKTLPQEKFEKGLVGMLDQLVTDKPIVFCVDSGLMYDPYIEEIRKKGYPVFQSAVRAAKALTSFIEYRNTCK